MGYWSAAQLFKICPSPAKRDFLAGAARRRIRIRVLHQPRVRVRCGCVATVVESLAGLDDDLTFRVSRFWALGNINRRKEGSRPERERQHEPRRAAGSASPNELKTRSAAERTTSCLRWQQVETGGKRPSGEGGGAGWWSGPVGSLMIYLPKQLICPATRRGRREAWIVQV